ncbi:MAG: sulfatase-like hydrolase/transferase [Clostridia bacterium]|nr:sulfatase-like hydrolase/transferase [Clostridia bacterium]
MSSNSKRNVVLIMCDQLRADFLNIYGADFIPTPNIDALAAEGCVFDNAITASTVCAPARMSCLTGEFVSGHDGWTNGIPTRDGTVFLPERLNDAGYMTAAVGLYDHTPNTEPLGYQYRKIESDLYGSYGCTSEETNGYLHYLKRVHPEAKDSHPADETGHFVYPEEDYLDRWCADCAIEFIDSYTKTGKAPNGAAPDKEGSPFFLYCGFNAPHGPHVSPKEVQGTVDPSKIPHFKHSGRPASDIPEVELYRRAYLNPPEAIENPDCVFEERMKERVIYTEMIVEVDNLVGRIIKSLKDNGIYENTTIIFTSDHGSVENDHNVVTKGPWPYRAQLFIPMVIANDPAVAAGTRCDALCGNLDIGATVLEIAGDNKAFGVSRSMIGLADGSVPEREVNLSEFCDSCKTVVDKRYTFTYYPFTATTCLFDRLEDPDEYVNLGGRPEYLAIERKFMMHVTDFMVLAKGVRLEAHDLNPKKREGIEKKHPKFIENFEIMYPITSELQKERLMAAGLSPDYNDFCIADTKKS